MNVTSYNKATLDTLLAGKATPAQITAAITQLRTDLLAGAPGALDTLNELAAALGNDQNYAATITTALNARPTAVQVAATYVAVQPTAPDPTKITAWVDKTTVPPTVKGWNGTAWVAIGGGGGGTVSDATTAAKGIVQLAGDLGGTAAAPTVPGLAAKAPLASPTFTGTPAVPTATAGTTTTQAASTAFVKAAIDALIAGAPGALDTLGEIAAQLAADETGVATLTTLLAQRTMSAAPVTLTAAGTLTPNVQNLLDATAGAFTATLPTPARIGQLLVVERADASTNLISIGGTVRGVTTGLPTLPGLGVAGEAITFVAESLTSWRPIASHKPKGLLDKQFDALGAADAKLAKTSNLADVASVQAAKDNLGVALGRQSASVATAYAYIFKNATDAYSFPPRVLPPQTTRRRVIIRNRGTSDVRIGYGTGVENDYNKPSDAIFAANPVVSPGQEWVDGPSEKAIFVRPIAASNAVVVSVYTELGV